MTQKPMTKTQLVAAIAENASIDKASANRALEALTEIVTKEVSQRRRGHPARPRQVRLPQPAPSALVRNPSTGEQMKKPADRVAKVTIAKQLKDVINA